MAGEWRNTTLGEVLTLQRGFDLPKTKRQPGRYEVIASTGPVGTHFEAKVEGPGVVIGRSGSIGGGQYIEHDFWPLNTTLWVKDFKGNDHRFCYYLLKSLDLGKFNVGSGVPTLNRNHIHPLAVNIPSNVNEQSEISHVLGTLDDKIELNRKMNETLESMAKTLFKSWFVDFDPVLDKALAAGNPIPDELSEAERRKQLGDKRKPLPEEIASLFPDEFENSELGRIPKGWRVGCISDIAIKINKSIKPKDLNPDQPYIALKNMPRESISLRYWEMAEGIESNKVQFKKYNILFGKLRPYFHKVGVAAIDGVCSTDIVVVSQNEDKWFGLLLSYLSSKKFVDYTAGTSTGTKMPRTNWRDMSRYKITIPHNEIAKVFNLHVLTVVQQIHKQIYEYHTLSNIRDTLLPKLISGELRVPDAEKIVGEVTA